MSVTEKDLLFTATHEWVSGQAPGVVTVGISEHAQDLLGDLVFVDLPEVGQHLTTGDEVVVLESVKTAADVYAPIAGEVLEINSALADNPSLVNQHPYSEGWLFKIKTNEQMPDSLLSQEAYQASLD